MCSLYMEVWSYAIGGAMAVCESEYVQLGSKRLRDEFHTDEV